MFTLKNEDVVKITTNGDTITRKIKLIDTNHFSYLEKNNNKCEVKINDNFITIIKSGEVNLITRHELDYVDKVNIEIISNGQTFYHDVEIKTIGLDIQDNEISIEFYSDDVKNSITYKVKEE